MISKCYSRLTQLLFKDRFLFLLISIAGFMIIAPLFKGSTGVRILMDMFINAVLITGIHAIGKKKQLPIIAISLALPLFISSLESCGHLFIL
ncbi:MAG: hypothetical protein MRK02_16595 [Candidatus Scalindua sp.]|nr:hypothetical protein [Candidatus Scalindua sp.]